MFGASIFVLVSAPCMALNMGMIWPTDDKPTGAACLRKREGVLIKDRVRASGTTWYLLRRGERIEYRMGEVRLTFAFQGVQRLSQAL